MELVNLMYRYVNRFINSNELIKELKKIDICNYQDKEVINKLIKDIEEVREKTPNEIDKVEKKRLEEIDNLLDKFKEVNTSDNELKEFIEKQYNNLEIINTNIFHDRFIIIDNKVLYHSGASFKDLGKKCFAITKIVDSNILEELLNKLKKCYEED